jgi:Xaa-Pro aminopeptidase
MTAAPAEVLTARHRALAEALTAGALDGLLVTHPPNITYLTGFSGSAGALVVEGARMHLVSDRRYADALRERAAEVAGLTAVLVPAAGSSIDEMVADTLAAIAPCRLGFEGTALSVRRHSDLRVRLERQRPNVEWRDTPGLVEALRAVKDPWEQATLREAGRRLSGVAKCIIPRALAGVTERDLAAVIETELRQAGFDKPAFDTIVASGPNAAQPHHRAGERRFENGDLVVIDFGGMFRGYAVDMTRTVGIGGMDSRQRQVWLAVADAQRAAFAACRAGIECEAVDAAARGRLEAAGLGEAFSHGLGHGLGLEVHEAPRLARRRADAPLGVLRVGMVFTLEPGAYVADWGGVRIEDDVLLTAAGPEWLTEPVDEVRAT